MSPLSRPRILVLDIGLSRDTPDSCSGEILEFTPDGANQRVLVHKQALPDGLVVDVVRQRMYWTCMGLPGNPDGALYSANIDGADIQTVVAPGVVNTPKQLTLDTESAKLYFCDREGLCVYRCNVDGSDLEALIATGEPGSPPDGMTFCVGIAVAPKLGKFYWTQKGPSKGNRGRIFCANISTPTGQSAASRSDIRCILNDLPEPIDLEIDEASSTLYWTDRGELPWGNSLSRVRLDESGLPLPTTASPQKYEVLARHFSEAIGLKLDSERGEIYVADLGGSIYRCDMDGKQKLKIYSEDSRAFTGIALL
ncbi:YWTD domain-containing protein [Penicillium cosmopolitanum]|uniref:YWTD domain-containing protein n=1 Tax=Penicillium cosmopolitanum TaxID=1131564 RepID=A0A9X0B956_9EURO|nr:YWTD domain-containing protein [Penicillium cosmopolitanum]KAJ5392663.1 YWTD domain-containing protein [Penicillium cosmopolitanum]